jgi:hypothetical protein
MPRASTSSDQGNRGISRDPPKSSTRAPTATASVAGWAFGTLCTSPTNRSNRAPPGLATPSRPGISPTTMSTTSPVTKPVTMGALRNWATQPTRSRPAPSKTMPASTANALVSRMAMTGSPLDRPRTTEPDSTVTVETGPMKSTREEPKST